MPSPQYRVIIEPSVPASQAALIAGVPPELLPPAHGDVPARPAWAGKRPGLFDRGESYRWLCYREGYAAAVTWRGRYRVEEVRELPDDLKALQARIDAVVEAGTSLRDDETRLTLAAEAQALTQLLARHADLSGRSHTLTTNTPAPVDPETDGLFRDRLTAALTAVEGRITHIEGALRTAQLSDTAEADAAQRAAAVPEAQRLSEDALDLLAQASAGSLATHLPHRRTSHPPVTSTAPPQPD
ncbi:hypothetical protein PZB75_30910 (plasmid) [Streptomyces sp. AM 4-1-1]|uniref:hypothetical protein n=1 Tax=Streptomyces sp. AM 4-1-1 TaxID=3028710 RepID=UPI0023B95800|nr:hypothetical protein [Streptomyces sp. AM 4-1-1]WEH37815.1 hypothetical protein PZB75_30910 [Streptomyces sp. AM 4-1-1]